MDLVDDDPFIVNAAGQHPSDQEGFRDGARVRAFE